MTVKWNSKIDHITGICLISPGTALLNIDPYISDSFIFDPVQALMCITYPNIYLTTGITTANKNDYIPVSLQLPIDSYSSYKHKSCDK